MRYAHLCTHCHTAFSWEPTVLMDHNLSTGVTSELEFCNGVHARRYVDRDLVDMELMIRHACDLMDRLINAQLTNSWELIGIRNQYLAALTNVAKYSRYSVAPK